MDRTYHFCDEFLEHKCMNISLKGFMSLKGFVYLV